MWFFCYTNRHLPVHSDARLQGTKQTFIKSGPMATPTQTCHTSEPINISDEVSSDQNLQT